MRQTKTNFVQRFQVWQQHDEYEYEIERDETQLIDDAKTDPACFGILYQRYLTSVYKYVKLRSGNDEDAADLTQQVFLQALKALPKYQHRKLPFSAWLFRIARNTTTDAHRQRINSVTWQFLTEISHPHNGQDLEGDTLRRETIAQLQRFLGQLNHEKRELLMLRFAAGLSSREIAFTLGKSEAAVKKQLTRIIAALKTQYEQEFSDEE